jgi:amino acid transporter
MTGGPNHDRIGFRYWKNPGPFAHFDGIAGSEGQFLGWWAVMTQAAFSFTGTEIVAVRRTGFLSIVRRLISAHRLPLVKQRTPDETFLVQLSGFTFVSIIHPLRAS